MGFTAYLPITVASATPSSCAIALVVAGVIAV